MEVKLIKKEVVYNDKKWFNVYVEVDGKKIQVQATPYKKKDGSMDYSNNNLLRFLAQEEK